MNVAFRSAGVVFALIGSVNLKRHIQDRVHGEDAFSQHTNEQHWRRWFSGMHKPYLPTENQQKIVNKYFSEFLNLIPFTSEEITEKNNIKSPVCIRRLDECPSKDMKLDEAGTVVVGGPPALFSTAFEKGITYINDGRQRPIGNGSAFHLEWDAVSEAPTTYRPSRFMRNQFLRLLLPESLELAEHTGHFSWKTLDWMSWIKNPSKWVIGARIAIAFERFTKSSSKAAVVEEVAERSKKNQLFYEKLDAELKGKLLLPGKGSIYVARTKEEKKALLQMKELLAKENRELHDVSSDTLLKQLLKGVFFGNKTHDRILSPHFLSLLSERVIESGGKVLDACVTTIYTNDPDQGGIVAYQTVDNKVTHYVPFKKLVMSLGTQQVLGVDNAPLFDIVAARGVSAIALAYLPEGANLPSSVVCGATNNVTKLAGPIPFNKQNLFLLRMTCGACITPLSDSADYDGIAAVGLKKAVSDVLQGRVEILSVMGCNRQINQYGQIHWLQVPKTLKVVSSILSPRGTQEDVGSSLPNSSSGIFIQYGAGGGGLTQAPSQI